MNSARQLNPQRHSLYSDKDHLLLTMFSALPDRGDECWRIIPIRNVHQFLKIKDLTSKFETNSGTRSWLLYRSSTRLPIFAKVARVALWGEFYGTLDGTRD